MAANLSVIFKYDLLPLAICTQTPFLIPHTGVTENPLSIRNVSRIHVPALRFLGRTDSQQSGRKT